MDLTRAVYARLCSLKALKTRPKRFLASQAFYNVYEFLLHLIGGPLHWLTDPDAEVGAQLACERTLCDWIWILYVFV